MIDTTMILQGFFEGFKIVGQVFLQNPILILIIVLAIAANMFAVKKNHWKLEDYAGRYTRQHLLTKNELSQFVAIESAVKRAGNYRLYTKVRLADIINPKEGRHYTTLFNKIKAKHVDFLVCDEVFTPMCVIEIDDSSHSRTDRKERDKFVDYILKDVGIPTIRTYSANSYELYEQIKKAVDTTANAII